MSAELEDDLSGEPWSPRTGEALEKTARAAATARELVDELDAATPAPESLLSPEDRAALDDLRRRQEGLRARADQLGKDAQRRGHELPGTSGEVAQKGLADASEQMGRGAERMGAHDPVGARDEARGAADKLGTLRQGMQRAGRPTLVGPGDQDPDHEPVRIPGSEEYRPPREFREDILEAKKKAPPPAPYRDMVDRYYQELIK